MSFVRLKQLLTNPHFVIRKVLVPKSRTPKIETRNAQLFTNPQFVLRKVLSQKPRITKYETRNAQLFTNPQFVLRKVCTPKLETRNLRPGIRDPTPET
jgi:hypothetical protein